MTEPTTWPPLGAYHRDRGGWIRILCDTHAALDRDELRALLRGER